MTLIGLADLTAITGMDRSAISKLEAGKRPNPTMDTLVRYAEAVGGSGLRCRWWMSEDCYKSMFIK